jgi:hypothetical protein
MIELILVGLVITLSAVGGYLIGRVFFENTRREMQLTCEDLGTRINYLSAKNFELCAQLGDKQRKKTKKVKRK